MAARGGKKLEAFQGRSWTSAGEDIADI